MKYYTAKQFAILSGLSYKNILLGIKNNKIKTICLNKRKYIPDMELEISVESRKNNAYNSMEILEGILERSNNNKSSRRLISTMVRQTN